MLVALILIVLSFFILGKLVEKDISKKQSDVIEIENKRSLLKIGFITDWEYGTRKQLGAKMTRKAPVEMAKAVIYLNEQFHPDIVIGGGDYIESSSVKPENAREQLKEINEIFSLIEAPKLYALGNHDLRSLTKAEVRGALGIQDNHEVKDVGDWRIVVIDTNFTEDGQHRSAKSYVTGGVSKEEINWLRESLKTERPVLVFSHHSPISNKGIDGVQNISNSQEVRNVLEEAGNVVAVISGHTPTSYFERLNGINYFIADTMVNINALGSFVTIEVVYDTEDKIAEITFRQLGVDNFEYKTEWKHGERREDYKTPQVEIDEVSETE